MSDGCPVLTYYCPDPLISVLLQNVLTCSLLSYINQCVLTFPVYCPSSSKCPNLSSIAVLTPYQLSYTPIGVLTCPITVLIHRVSVVLQKHPNLAVLTLLSTVLPQLTCPDQYTVLTHCISILLQNCPDLYCSTLYFTWARWLCLSMNDCCFHLHLKIVSMHLLKSMRVKGYAQNAMFESSSTANV